ncbi:methylmalonyl-CoA epimerase [Bacillus solitudinis]|uniref:methylmalonyl-CoA epimerase n=1 Tax=Bacillus solitudinis TaxID=2014074 RepID=UPI000C2483DC|nr:methylmalonyl-CoA epimerase [Bacillus solitudinis]
MSENAIPTRIDHIGIAVASIEEALPFYVNHLHMRCVSIEEVKSEGVRIAFLSVGESFIELLEPLTSESPVSSFIKKYGEGIHHIALGVTSLQARLKELNQNKVSLIHEQSKQGAEGLDVAFIHPKAANGVLYELCERNRPVRDCDN